MIGFLWFLARVLIVLFTLQALIGLGRYVSRGVRITWRRGLGGSRSSRPEGEPMIDRTSVIDVPYTEEKRNAARDNPPDASAPEARPESR